MEDWWDLGGCGRRDDASPSLPLKLANCEGSFALSLKHTRTTVHLFPLPLPLPSLPSSLPSTTNIPFHPPARTTTLLTIPQLFHRAVTPFIGPFKFPLPPIFCRYLASSSNARYVTFRFPQVSNPPPAFQPHASIQPVGFPASVGESESAVKLKFVGHRKRSSNEHSLQLTFNDLCNLDPLITEIKYPASTDSNHHFSIVQANCSAFLPSPPEPQRRSQGCL
jgi:hypothetical protein